MKRARKKLPKGMTRLPNGSFRIRGKDSNGQPYDRSFKTEDEAKDALDQIAAKKATGTYVATAATTSFGELLDNLLAYKKGAVGEHHHRTQKSHAKNLRDAFGTRRLDEFEAERMTFVQDWFYTSALSTNYQKSHRSLIKEAFEHAIVVMRVMGRPNPVDHFGIKIRRRDDEDEEGGEDKVLTFDEMIAVLRAARTREHGEEELACYMRFVLVVLGLLTGLRPNEMSALYWDCVDLDGRMIYVRRSWRRFVGVVRLTKTGRKGFGNIPMSPVLHAVLLWWRDLLQEFGLPTTGEVPVLVTARAEIVRPEAITSRGHWERIARKAGLADPKTKALTSTSYCLRHTAINMWRVLDGIDLGHLRKLARHTTINMTIAKYEHEAPHLAPLRREVQALGLERTLDGCIDGLGIVLRQRWLDAGLDIPCSPPRQTSLPQHRLPNYHGENASALPSNVIELRPSSVMVDAPPQRTLTTYQEFRDWQMERAREMHRQGATNDRIVEELGVNRTAVGNWLRAPEARHILMTVPLKERKGIQERCREDYESGRYKYIRELAQAHGVLPGTVASWARKGGWQIPREAPDYKLAQHDALIRQAFKDRKKIKPLARQLGVNPSALWRYANRHGLRDPQQDAADKAARKARVLKHLADGKSYSWIANEEDVDISTVWRWNKERRAQSQSQADLGTDLTLDAAG